MMESFPAVRVTGVLTVKPCGSVADCPSGFVTTTFQAPACFPVRSSVHAIRDDETTETPVATISGCPDLVSRTVAPFWKPVPARSVIWTALPVYPEFGVIPAIAGAGI